jgi:probable HAF family extracellular repeat protein
VKVRRASRHASAFFTLALAAASSLAADKPVFVQLADGTVPQALGGNGFTAAGNLYGLPTAFYWMPTIGVVPMGGLGVAAVSVDGKTFVGDALDSRRLENAAIWRGGTEWRVLGSFTPNAQPCDALLSSAYGASDDGKVIVGLAWDGCTIAHGFRWDEASGMRDLGSTVAGQSSRANGVSGDGAVVIGWQESPTGFRQGARWVNGAQQLFRGPSGSVGEAHGTNVNGTVVVGGGCNPLDPTISSAWVWTAAAGIRCYPFERTFNPRRIAFNTIMFVTSDDGRVIGGASTFGLDSDALLWIDGEPKLLRDYLRENGIPDAFEGWVNTGFITAISRDGRTLVGYGAGPRNFTGYMVLLPPLKPRTSSEAR